MTNATKNTTPPDELLLHAYLDGELDPANTLMVEQKIASNPALAAERARTEALRQVLREKLPRESAPLALRLRIEAAVGLRRMEARPTWRALAASVVLAIVLASGSTWYAMHTSAGDHIFREVVDGHMRALMATQATDVTSSDRHTVKPWFAGRIPQAPRVIDLTQDGFPLVGGRIDVIGGTPVPTLVYRHRQHLISLIAVPGNSSEVRDGAIKGYNVFNWNADGIAYYAVSDLGISDLDKFTLLFRSGPPDR